MWKSNYPVNLIIGCVTLGSKNYDQAFRVTGHNSCGRIVTHSCCFKLLFCSSSTGAF